MGTGIIGLQYDIGFCPFWVTMDKPSISHSLSFLEFEIRFDSKIYFLPYTNAVALAHRGVLI